MNEPQQIDFRQWHHLFKQIPDQDVENTRYFRHLPDAEWSQYLFPPSTHNLYGNRLIRKLKFDNSPASLRLWGYVLSEGERIYRARQAGMKVAAVMGDLGAVPPLIYAFENVTVFYPDCLWWTPFMMESKVLFDEAGEFGLGDDCCFVRASLGAFAKKAYFPQPDFSVAAVGATCDDMSAVISEAEFLGNEIHYFELPHRHDDGSQTAALKKMLARQYRDLCRKIELKFGQKFSETRFFDTLTKVNEARALIAESKDILARSPLNPMGAVEMMCLEFSALSYYGDLDECILCLRDVRDEMKSRLEQSRGYPGQNLRLVWITPPADPLLMNYAEDLSGRIVGSEYLINQTTPLFKTEGDPFDILAEAHLSASLTGSSDFRVKLTLEELERTSADGVIISGIFGSSHCPYETIPVMNALREKNIPVLAFDVVAPGKKKLQSQILNRMQAFMESLQARQRRRHAG
ncbi:MAG: 2-hydroxyacyl-CoA dehydratase [FCB group bacterium]|nr:2-hydroxyacyl-CoA dehydratase [FCB group bacterium]